MSRFRVLVISLCMVISLVAAGQAFAVPTFTNGFTDWSAQVVDMGYVSSAVDPATDSHFSLSGNRATITYSDINDPYWTFTLSQLMAADSLQGAGYKLNLSFYMQVGLGGAADFNGHVISATLGSDALVNTSDASIQNRLLAGDIFSYDITSYAGSSNLLEFSLADIDWSVTDFLTIGDFAFTQIAPPTDPGAPVPEPGTMVLFGVGLAGLAFYRKRAKA